MLPEERLEPGERVGCGRRGRLVREAGAVPAKQRRERYRDDPVARCPLAEPVPERAGGEDRGEGQYRRELPGVQRRAAGEGTREVGREVGDDARQEQLTDQF